VRTLLTLTLLLLQVGDVQKSRREELLAQLKAVEEAIAKKRSKISDK
jgi:hypothetical protein